MAAGASAGSGQINEFGINTSGINGGNVALIAAGNIHAGIVTGSITTNATTGQGGNVTVIAGASNSVGAGSTVVSGSTSAGGSVNLFSPGFSVDTSSTSPNGNGGAINVVAYKGTIGASQIISSGDGTGTSGDIVLAAGASDGTQATITANTITTNGGQNSTGNVTIATATPLHSLTINNTTGVINDIRQFFNRAACQRCH